MTLLKLKKSERIFLNFTALLNFDFVLWILFPTNKLLSLFKVFLKNNGLNVKCLKTQVFNRTGFSWLTKGDLFMVASETLEEFTKIFSFFVKDAFFKKWNFKYLQNMFEVMNFENGFIVSVKMYNFIFKSNFDLFFFFKEFLSKKFNVFVYYNLLILKTTTVVLYSIMLIINKVFLLIWAIFFRILNMLLSTFILYANKKPACT